MTPDPPPKPPGPGRPQSRTTQGARAAPGPAAKRGPLMELSEKFGVPGFDVSQAQFPLSNLDLLPLEVARRYIVLPVQVRDDAVFLAMADPSERRVIEEIEFVSGRRVFPYVAEKEPLTRTIDFAYKARSEGHEVYAGPRATHGALAPATQMATLLNRGPVGAVAKPAPEEGPLASLDDELNPLEGALTPSVPGLDHAFDDGSNKQTILVVDDDDDIRKLLRKVLTERGYRVVEADRGSTALAIVKQEVPDGIVLDAMLPELHGFEICRRIKSSGRYGHIPILMVSAVYRGWRFAEDLKAAYGVTAYIEKPFRIQEIVAAVEQMLAGITAPKERDPDALSTDTEAILNDAMARYKRGDMDGAIQRLQEGVTVDPLAFRLRYHLALLVGRKGDLFRAIQELEVAVDLNPKSFSALKNLAVLYQQAGFRNKAIELWERALGQSPDDATRAQLKEHLVSLL